MIHHLIDLLKIFPEYIPAVWAAGTILALAIPFYLAVWYFAARRKLIFRLDLRIGVLGVFILFAGLAFLLASPLAHLLHPAVIRIYLFVTYLFAASVVVSLIDVFFVEHYLIQRSRVYVSPLLRKLINITVFSIGFLLVLRGAFSFNPLALVAIPTILSAGVAFALQDTLKTFIAGIGLGQVIRLGEWVAFQGQEGKVVDINWARTVLLTSEGDYVFIPNSQLQTQTFVNYTSHNPLQRRTLRVGAAYDASPARVKQVLLSSVAGVRGVALQDPAPTAQLAHFGDSAIEYALFYWIEDFAERSRIHDEIATRVWYAFEKEGIEIPFPIRTVQLQKKKAKGTEPAPVPSQKVLAALAQWELSQVFSDQDLTELAHWVRLAIFTEGQPIVRQGDEGLSLFIVLEGMVEIQREVGGSTSVLAVLGRSQVFGEMSLLTGAPRSTTVVAKGTVEVLEIRKEGLQTILTKRPSLADVLGELVTKRQGELTQTPAVMESSSQGDTPMARRIREFFGL